MSQRPVFPEKNSEGEFYPPFFVDAAGSDLRRRAKALPCIAPGARLLKQPMPNASSMRVLPRVAQLVLLLARGALQPRPTSPQAVPLPGAT